MRKRITLTLTNYDSRTVYEALIAQQEVSARFAARVGNDYLQRLAERFKTEETGDDKVDEMGQAV